jgi:hypothetical protein
MCLALEFASPNVAEQHKQRHTIFAERLLRVTFRLGTEWSFPWPALEKRITKSQSPRRPVLGTGPTCPRCRLSSKWKVTHWKSVNTRAFLGTILHAGQTTVDFEGWRQAFQPEPLCRSDGSSQAVAQAVTDGSTLTSSRLTARYRARFVWREAVARIFHKMS